MCHPGLWTRPVTLIRSTWEETSWRRCPLKHWARWETSETWGCLGIQFAGWGRMLFGHWRGHWRSCIWITWDWRRWAGFRCELIVTTRPFPFSLGSPFLQGFLTILWCDISYSRCHRTPLQVWVQGWGVFSWKATTWRRCLISTLSLLWRSSTWPTTLWCVTALCCHYACKAITEQ